MIDRGMIAGKSGMAAVSYYPSGAVLNFGAGDITLTHTADTLTLAGGVLVLPDGAPGAPVLARATDVTTGIFFPGAGRVGITSAGVQQYDFGINLGIKSTVILGWTSGAATAALDAQFGREAPAIIQMGLDSATPIAQTLKGADARAGTDTDTVGGKLTIGAGRSTGTGATAGVAIATGVHATTANTANANVDRVLVNEYGVVGFTPHDNTAVPVASTAALKLFAYNKSVADHGIITMPVITSHAYGILSTNSGATYSHFVVDATGTVTLLGPLVMTTADVVANAATDAKVDIGTAGAQEPLQIANELGATHVFNILFWYD